MSEKDIFYLDKILPEPDKVFGFNYKPLSEVVKDCVFVFDTNVLFVPFDASEENLDEIKKIFIKLKSENKLFLPARVVREFANNRAKRLGDLFLKIRQSKDKLNSGNFKVDYYPLLQSNPHYQELVKNFGQIGDLIKASRKLLEQVETDILSWNWDDNVSRVYKEVFTSETIKEVQKSEDDLIKDLKFRIEHKIAPGYKDSGKLDDGIGDLVVWQTALEIAKDQDKDLILVSNDQKNDWFYKQDKEGLYPKYELFDEFRRFTNGKSMQIINFPLFLEILDAAPETITEIKESIENSESDGYLKGHSVTDLVVGMMIEHSKFGNGIIKEIKENDRGNHWFKVAFDDYGTKQLLIRFTPMKIPNNNHNRIIRNPDVDEDENSSLSTESE